MNNENEEKFLIFFLHLNNSTMCNGINIISSNNLNSEKTQKAANNPILLCIQKNKELNTTYSMYSFSLSNFFLAEKSCSNISKFVIQIIKTKESYLFEIPIPIDYIINNQINYYFYTEKIIFKENKKSFFEKFFKEAKGLRPIFSCDINLYEQLVLIFAFINTTNLKVKFIMLANLVKQIGWQRFSSFNQLLLIYLNIIFVDNFNIELIHNFLENYNEIYFDLKNSFNSDKFFMNVLKSIFLIHYDKKTNFIKFQHFEFYLQNCLNAKYNTLIDKLFIKYLSLYEKDYLFREIINKNKKVYEIYYEILLEMNNNKINYINNKNYFSKEYKFLLKERKSKILKNKIYFNIYENDFHSLHIKQGYENYHLLGKLNNLSYLININCRELYLYDMNLKIKKIINIDYAKNIADIYQLIDNNFISAYSSGKKIGIFEINNLGNTINKICDLNFQNDDFINKIIETNNKYIVLLSLNHIFIFYNEKNIEKVYNYKLCKNIENENKNLKSISLIEFNTDFIIVISAIFSDNEYLSNKIYIQYININSIINISFSNFKVNNIIMHLSEYKDNNILVKLNQEMLGIGGYNNLYLFNINSKEIIQIIELQSIENNFSVLSSFFYSNYQTIFVAVKYFNNHNENENSNKNEYNCIKYFLYLFCDEEDETFNDNDKDIIFIDEIKINPFQDIFYNLIEI